jgi:hypothetical protein
MESSIHDRCYHELMLYHLEWVRYDTIHGCQCFTHYLVPFFFSSYDIACKLQVLISYALKVEQNLYLFF